jgi:hypothetical protein
MPQQNWEADGPEEEGAIILAEFAPEDSSSEFKKCLKRLGRRRKRYRGRFRSSQALWALALLIGGGVVALGGGFAALTMSASPGVRLGVAAGSLAILVLGAGLAWGLRALEARQNESAPRFDFHDYGGVYRSDEGIAVFSWSAIGQVMFRPDSRPGRTSELIISRAPQQPWQAKGERIVVQALPNALVLDSHFFPLADLYAIARHLHKILGHLRVEAHSRDGRLYRLD